ncbi:type II secretion system protein N [Pseudomonas entomophila]|uniref:type II secretion system protein N n=1 Tax=Pseudomonas entomophila TaxID=312306 RepID=UPI002405F0B6|nr:type II secretion system protein N [Pseudomonas entomophila]MDF9619641.1 type II secretion system protein N [Pseudomonas entomophila]
MQIPRITVSSNLLLQGLGALAAVAGVLAWAWVLVPSAPSAGPAEPASAQAMGEVPAARWFADIPVQVDIKVSGVMAGSRGAVAIVSLDGGPARAMRSGEELARGVRLVAIEADGLLIERAGQRSRVEVPVLARTSSWSNDNLNAKSEL